LAEEIAAADAEKAVAAMKAARMGRLLLRGAWRAESERFRAQAKRADTLGYPLTTLGVEAVKTRVRTSRSLRFL
jgi:hypothetical protein